MNSLILLWNIWRCCCTKTKTCWSKSCHRYLIVNVADHCIQQLTFPFHFPPKPSSVWSCKFSPFFLQKNVSKNWFRERLPVFRHCRTEYQPIGPYRWINVQWILALPEAHFRWTVQISDYSFAGAPLGRHSRLATSTFKSTSSPGKTPRSFKNILASKVILVNWYQTNLIGTRHMPK